ncbi:MAG: ribonuclease catalytic domain-containing protein [Alphaproteobacteria bacterium]|nr:ribonuclease catalytic domain-containing protein [Alphaproteobacteria bacterium]
MPGLKKRAFSLHEQSVATATGHIRFIDRHTRPVVKGYPIDDIDPTRATDRDDAVYAEKTPTGYALHVTIADVAAHIPKNSPLDAAAQSRAFTIYRPPARDPMFPFILSEDRFSLEHEQKRLGVTISIDLDEQFKSQGVRFTRTIIESECQDYATASHRMIQEGDDMEMLGRIARGIKDSARPPMELGGGSDTYMDKAGILHQADAGAMAASKLVQVAMIFANNEIANFFSNTDLPFLYRNHLASPDNTSRAEYQPYDQGHYSLRSSEGLVGAYSHCTSPIRRYADLVNQRMQHYVMDVVEGVANELSDCVVSHVERNKAEFLPMVWEQADNLMSKTFAVHHSQGHNRVLAERALRESMDELLQQVDVKSVERSAANSDPKSRLAAAALKPDLPYTHKELSLITPNLNAAQDDEVEAVTELNRRNLDKWNERIEDDLATGNFDKFNTNAFSALLRRAAVTGRINTGLAQETAKRIHQNTIDLVPDCYSILILNESYQDKQWRGLKRKALNTIEHDPMVVNNIFEKGKKEGEIHPETNVVEAKIRDSAAEKAMPLLTAGGVQQQIDAALMVTYMPELGNREYAAPTYSLGYTQKDCARHATFNFIRALTFGELGPLDQTILPTPLYAELANDERKRADVLHEMAENMDLTIRELGPRERPDGQYSFAYQVYGPGIQYPIVGFVAEPSVEQAREKSATSILRNMRFKRAYAQENPTEIGFPTQPAHVVRELAEKNSWQLTEPDRSEIKEVERGVFGVKLMLKMDEETLETYSEGRNKDNALHYGFEAMRDKLQDKGLLPKEQQASDAGWVTWSRAPQDTKVHSM